MVLSASSSGFETFFSIVSGSAPGRIVVTVTIGNSTSGIWSTPMRGYEKRPNTTTASSSMLVKMGRRMNVRIGLTGGLARCGDGSLQDADAGAVLQAAPALRHDERLGADAGQDAERARAELLHLHRLAAQPVGLDRPDVRTVLAELDRGRRQEEPLRRRSAGERQLDDRPRAELAVRAADRIGANVHR